MIKKPEYLEIKFLSDSCFSKGEETPGVVDIEVEHDNLGLPMIGGKTIHGLLRDAWLSIQNNFKNLAPSFEKVFGIAQDNNELGILRISDAKMNETIAAWVNYAQTKKEPHVSPDMTLESLTNIRTQISQDSQGVTEEGSLRTCRVANRHNCLLARLKWFAQPDSNDIQCLALAALATRHGGQSRNRGLGHIKITFDSDYALTQKIAQGGN
jgi:hypothetical protein